jgi:hypothetical protein
MDYKLTCERRTRTVKMNTAYRYLIFSLLILKQRCFEGDTMVGTFALMMRRNGRKYSTYTVVSRKCTAEEARVKVVG